MVPCPGRVLRYQGERLRAADHVASSSAAVKDVSRLRLPVRRTRYFRWACRGLSETPRGSSLDEWAAAERVLVQFLALPVLPGAASTTSGPPRRAPSWRICAVQTDTREHHAAHVAGWSRTSTSASLSTCAGGKFSFERASSCRSRSAGRRVEVGGTTTSELFRRGAPVEARWAGLCSIVRLATAFSRGQGLGSADGYGRCSLEVRKRLHTALRQARGRLRSEPGGRHVRRVPLSRTDQLRMTHTCCSAQVGSAFSSFGGGRDEDAVCAACLSAVAGLFE